MKSKLNKIVGLVSLFVAIILPSAVRAQQTVVVGPVVPQPCPPGYDCGNTPMPGGGSVNQIPNRIPLTSEATLTAYAWTLVSDIFGNVSGSSVSGTNSFYTEYPFADANPEHMAAVARAKTLRFSADPMEELEASLAYNSSKVIPNWGFQVFHGSKKFYLENGKGGWQVPANAYEIVLERDNYIPLPMKGVISAYIQTKNEKGEYVGYYNFASDGRINTEAGFIALGSEHLAQHGELHAVFADRTQIIWDLPSGKKKETTPVSLPGFNPSMKGVRTLPVGTSDIRFQAGDMIVQVSYKSDSNVSVTFPVGLASGEYPSLVYVVDADEFAADPTIDWEEFNPIEAKITFAVKTGQRIFVRFERPAQPGKLPQPSYGEKGPPPQAN